MSPAFCDALPRAGKGILAAILFAGWTVGAGCSGGAGAGPAAGAAGATGAGMDGAAGAMASNDGATSGDGNAVVGTFVVALKEPLNGSPAYTAIIGSVKDHADPVMVPLVQAAKDGDCALFKPHVPFCATSCGQGVCVADDTCASYGTNQDVGAVTLTGVAKQAGAPPLTLTYVNKTYQPPADQTPAYPPFAEGDDIAVSATGGAYGPFSTHAKGIAPLALTGNVFTLEKNQSFTLTWAAAGAGATSTVHLRVDISHHGGLKGEIDCDAADSGSLTISAALVTQLLNLGYAGYPSFTFTRISVGSTLIAPGRVELELSESLDRNVQIPGLTSCTADGDCPTGQTCQTDLQCK